jgi:Fe-S oxidoreductase
MEALEHLAASSIFGAPLADAAAWAVTQGLVVPPLGEVLYHQPCHDSMKGRGVPVLRQVGAQVRQVPACCGEAGTLALSRPDIAGKLFDRKEQELAAALSERSPGVAPAVLLTNCPACLQGLGRQTCDGVKVQHLAIRLAEAARPDWKTELKSLVAGAEVVTF